MPPIPKPPKKEKQRKYSSFNRNKPKKQPSELRNWLNNIDPVIVKPAARNGMSKEKVRAKVKELDGNWCLLCGKPGPGLHLHRVVYGAQKGKYEIKNCVLLCYECHENKVHANKRKWQPKLLEHIKRRDEGYWQCLTKQRN